jgi:hypothetical protein
VSQRPPGRVRQRFLQLYLAIAGRLKIQIAVDCHCDLSLELVSDYGRRFIDCDRDRDCHRDRDRSKPRLGRAVGFQLRSRLQAPAHRHHSPSCSRGVTSL